MKKLLGRVVLVVALLATALSFGASTDTAAQTGNTVTVRPGYMHGWAFIDDNGNGGTGEMVEGPATAPLGYGSARLALGSGNQGYALGTAQYLGVDLSNITELEYSTFRSNPGPQVVALQLNIDVDSTDQDAEWQGRLVFEPYHDDEVVSDEWQTWGPLSGAAGWWFSKAPGNASCPQSDPCTWNEVKDAFPNAQVHPSLGGVVLKAGSGWPNFDGNVDKLTIGVNNVNTTYDFEPPVPCDWADTSDTVKTLEADCSTDQRIRLEDGFTYDGNGHTVSAYGDLFSRVIQAFGEENEPAIDVSLQDLTVKIDRSEISEPTDHVVAIGFHNVNGSIRNNHVIFTDAGADDTSYPTVGIYAAIGDISISGNSASGFDFPIINTFNSICYTKWTGALRLPTEACAPWESELDLAWERGGQELIDSDDFSICVRDGNGLARYSPNGNCDSLWGWWDNEVRVNYPNANLISICVDDDTGRVRVSTSCSGNEWAGQI